MAQSWQKISLSFWFLLIIIIQLVSSHTVPQEVNPYNNAEEIARLEEELRNQIGEEADYTNEFAVIIPGGTEVADKVAKDLGFVNLGQVGSLLDHYVFKKSSHSRRSKRHAEEHTRSLSEDSRVAKVEQQRSLKREKRDLIEKREEQKAYDTTRFNDPYWKDQWYLYDSRSSSEIPKVDLHVIPVWAKNITGAGIVVSILDDGIEHNHTDLAANYDPRASYDLNDNDDDPFPRYEETNENKHGTRCAGEVSMISNNGFCGVGVAYNSRIGGVRMLDGEVSDSLEAKALNFNNDHIHIYSASWGPRDDGKTLEKPGLLATAALEKGVTEGRGGKGVIYVWASGNGGVHNDNCGCDGYVSSIYTLAVSSASQGSESPWYSEPCPSTMATTYSSGQLKQIVSADLHNECTTQHTGTSASAPLAAGIFALALEVNPDLTWRDLQHLVAWTSEVSSLQENEGWQRNGAGFWVNNKFGFGLLNAAALVNASDRSVFKSVPKSSDCEVRVEAPQQGLPRFVNSGETVTVSINTDGCKGGSNEINFLEHVVVTLDMLHTNRGRVQIFLTSPSGLVTQLLTKREQDTSKAGFNGWPFMSVHNWGENPTGVWTLLIVDEGPSSNDQGLIKSVSLKLYGTRDQPDHVKAAGGQRIYNTDYNKIHNIRSKISNEGLDDDQEAALKALTGGYDPRPLNAVNPLMKGSGDINSAAQEKLQAAEVKSSLEEFMKNLIFGQ